MQVMSVSAVTSTDPERLAAFYRDRLGVPLQAASHERSRAARSDNWARVAAELGYHDQAHFIHDVRELFGATPRQLVALAAKTR